MADIDKINIQSTRPSAAPSAPNAVDIATNRLGQRIEKTTEGVASVSQGSNASQSSGGATVKVSSSLPKQTKIPSTEEEIRSAIEECWKEEIDTIRDEVRVLEKEEQVGMAYHITTRVIRLRQLHVAIKSLYEMAKNQLLEVYKTIFKAS